MGFSLLRPNSASLNFFYTRNVMKLLTNDYRERTGGKNGCIRQPLIYKTGCGDGEAVELGGVGGGVRAGRHDIDSIPNVHLGKLRFI